MVRVELSYNPYLLETRIKFNGQLPKINSLVEKYKYQKLQVWLDELPEIFHDEMNGYDFDLYFNGTELDFNDLRETIENQISDSTEGTIRLFHNSELESVKQKEKRLEELLQWIVEHPNNRLDLSVFTSENLKISEESYPFLLILGYYDALSIVNQDFEFIQIQEIQQLPEDLSNLPIVLYLDSIHRQLALEFVETILSHNEVIQEQLFFTISQDVKTEVAIRTLQDIGVKNPYIISSLSDDRIRHYIEIYPRLVLIQQYIQYYQTFFMKIKEELGEEVKESEKANQQIYKNLAELEEQLSHQKELLERVAQRNNYKIPHFLKDERNHMIQKIKDWRKKKTVISTDTEADKFIEEFIEELSKYFKTFKKNIKDGFNRSIAKILESYQLIYKDLQYSDDFQIESNITIDFSKYKLSDIRDDLKKCRKIQFVPKEDIVDWFAPFIKIGNGNAKELVKKVRYENKDFKNVAIADFTIVANEMIKTISEELLAFYDKVAIEYTQHLEALIQQTTNQREELSLQLSAEQKLLQDDIEWLTEILDQLKMIERG